MTTYTVERITGGNFNGAGGKPGGTMSSITTDGPNRYAVVCVWTCRTLNSLTPDYHRLSAVSGGGLSWSHTVSKDFTYDDIPGGGGFPNNYWHLDVWTAPVPSQLTGSAMTYTMSGGDTFQNVCWGVLMTINGPTTIDADGSNLVNTSSLAGGGASAIASNALDTAGNPLVLLAMLAHKSGGGTNTITIPAGFASAGSVSGNSHFTASSNGSGADCDIALCFKEEASAQSAKTYSTSTSHDYWYEVPIVLNGSGSTPQPATEPVIIITQ